MFTAQSSNASKWNNTRSGWCRQLKDNSGVSEQEGHMILPNFRRRNVLENRVLFL
jgi:hypothetical protein